MSFQHSRTRILLYYLGNFLVYLGVLLVTLVIIWLGLKGYGIYRSYRTISQHMTILETALTSEQAGDSTAQLETSGREIATALDNLYRDTRPFFPLMSYLGWAPVYGGDLQAAPQLLAAGRDLGQTGLILLDSLAPVLRAEAETEQAKLMPQIVAGLSQASPGLAQAEVGLRQHQLALAELDPQQLSPGMARRVVQLNQYFPQLISGLQLLQAMPVLLGAETPQTYLILTQNADELRPSGGYINAAGHVTVFQGQIIEFILQDSYAVDNLSDAYPYPPDPIYQYMAAEYWVLRDASWSPDFPTAARTAIELYELGQGIAADGVISFDQHALTYLLQALGPINVNDDRVTGDNVIELMRKRWAPTAEQDLNREWLEQRKSFMLLLGETLRHRLETDFGSINLPVLAASLNEALTRKHIVVYAENPALAGWLVENNWAGSLQDVQGDFLMAVDANLGFNKASPLVARKLKYHITLAPNGSAEARTRLSYQHRAPAQTEPCRHESRYDRTYEQNMERCYWDYVQLIVPAEAHLITGPEIMVEGQYLLRGQPTTGEIDITTPGHDKISWGQLFLLAPQEKLSLNYEYTLPLGAVRFVQDHWEYTLYLQKQPGTLETPAEITVTLPEGSQFLESRPSPTSEQTSTLTYQLDLTTDQEIAVSYIIPYREIKEVTQAMEEK